MTDFTVEAIAGGRVSVSWEDGEHVLSFNALMAGGELGEITGRYGNTKTPPVIYKRRKAGGRGSLTFGGAEEFAPIIAEARAWIGEQGLVPKAIQERADRLAETERQRVKAKADAMREALEPMGWRPINAVLGSVPDEDLAKAYDEIQNSCA